MQRATVPIPQASSITVYRSAHACAVQRSAQHSQPVLNPVSANLLHFYPHANQGTNTFVGTQTLTSNSDQFGIRARPFADHE